MRTIVIAFLVTASAVMALGQDAPGPAREPDFSRPTLMRLFVVEPQTSMPRFSLDVGRVTLRTRGVNLILGYLPFLAPLPGSVPTTTRHVVDPFELTHTELAMTPRIASRERQRELRRIEHLATNSHSKDDSPASDDKAAVRVAPQ